MTSQRVSIIAIITATHTRVHTFMLGARGTFSIIDNKLRWLLLCWNISKISYLFCQSPLCAIIYDDPSSLAE